MNARQKAKHYKWLYEKTKTTYVTPVVTYNAELKHIIARHSVPSEEKMLGCNSELLKKSVTRNLMRQLENVLKDKIVEKPEQYNHRTQYELEIWVR